jgi:hypothetical protein
MNCFQHGGLVLLVTASLFVAGYAGKCKDWTGLKEGDSCHQHWGEAKYRVHPTQPTLGYAWAMSKFNDNFRDKTSAQKTLNKKPIPVCLGPGNGAWMVDHHHTLAALDYSGFSDVSVTFNVVCAFDSSLPVATFWNYMVKQKGVFNYARPEADALYEEVRFDSLPRVLYFNRTSSSFQDDHWRALAGFAKKIRNDECTVKYCYRAFIKWCDSAGDAVPFFEFRWAYFFNDAYLEPAKLWDQEIDYYNFSNIYYQLKGQKILKSNDLQEDLVPWRMAAAALLPLARGQSAGSYIVPRPNILYGSLPGYVSGMGPIKHKDPNCNPPRCKIARRWARDFDV